MKQFEMRLIKVMIALSPLLFLASQCEKDNGDPFDATQEGKDVLGFYLEGMPYKQQNSRVGVAPYSPLSTWIMRRIKPTSAEKTSLLSDDYYYFFNLEADVKRVVGSESTVYDVASIYLHLADSLPFIEGQRYRIAAYPEEQPPFDEKKYNHIRVRFYTPISTITQFGENGYIEFTKFDMENNIASGNFTVEVDEAPTGEEQYARKKFTKGVFDAHLNVYGFEDKLNY
jgi:hypothetical protein